MLVDYQIIHGDVWTRALSNEFMQVPESLQGSVAIKSLQVIFAVLIVHFMLKITGIYGRNTLITAAFVLAMVMIGSLGYLVAYNNMAGATSATLEQQDARCAGQQFDRPAPRFLVNGTRQPPPPASAQAKCTKPDARRSLRRSFARRAEDLESLARQRRFLDLAGLCQRDLLHRHHRGGALHPDRGEQHPQLRDRARLCSSQAAFRPASPARARRRTAGEPHCGYAGMMRFMLAVATGAALGAGSAYAVQVMERAPVLQPAAYVEQARTRPERIIVGIDLSASNPLVADPVFAAKVADRIAARIQKLGFHSEVHVRTLGNFDASSNGFYYDTVLSIRARPEDVAAEVRKLIAGTPLLVSKGKWKAQAKTNILAFLDNVSQSIGCAGLPTTRHSGVRRSGGFRICPAEVARRPTARAGRHAVCRLCRAGDPGNRAGHPQPQGDCAAPGRMGALGQGGRIQAISRP